MPLNETESLFSGGMIESQEYKTDVISALKITPVFFMIDISQSMAGNKIGIVNSTMEEIVRELHDYNSSDSEIRFAILSFGTNCTWETGDEGLIPCEGFWNDLSVDGLTYFNTACRTLKEKLSGTNGFFKFAAGRTITPPVIILLTDGYANDANFNSNGDEGIAELNKNKYFRGAYRIAIAVGDGANQTLCENFTGDKELVYTTHNTAALRKILNIVVKNSVTVSSSGVSQLNSADVKIDEVAPSTVVLKKQLQNEVKADKKISDDFNVVDDDWD
ncbi:MAG: VWA domain-containing protein [Ruminococcus sp.]|nr:VWA domain-containing protein [Ruminococcus sp.]